MDKSIFTDEYGVLLGLLREARTAAGLSQIRFAARLGKSQSFVSKVEQGETRIDVIQLRTICLALGTTLPAFVARLEERLASRGRPTGRGRGRAVRPTAASPTGRPQSRVISRGGRTKATRGRWESAASELTSGPGRSSVPIDRQEVRSLAGFTAVHDARCVRGPHRDKGPQESAKMMEMSSPHRRTNFRGQTTGSLIQPRT
jgi:transcriptional regulator with XRE-family HTH domain